MKQTIKWAMIALALCALVIITERFIKDEVNKNIHEDIKTEMLQVQAKAKIILENYHVDNENGLEGEKMEDTSLEEKFKISNISNYYKWTKETLGNIGLTDTLLKTDEYYLVNYEIEDVVYVTKNGDEYYKLSEIKKSDEQKENWEEENHTTKIEEGENDKDEGEGTGENK